MAQPNIVSVTTIRGNTEVANVTNISSNLVTNLASSDKVLKVNALYMTNINTSTSSNSTIAILRSGVEYYLGKSIVVPAASTLDVISKSVYLQEGDALRVSASANNFIQAIASYEEIS